MCLRERSGLKRVLRANRKSAVLATSLGAVLGEALAGSRRVFVMKRRWAVYPRLRKSAEEKEGEGAHLVSASEGH